jgi:hypothetical protein
MKAMMEAMEKIKGEIAQLAKQAQKKGGGNNENINPNTPGIIPTIRPKATVKFGEVPMLKATRALCPNCKRWGRHMEADCLELEANKEKTTSNVDIEHQQMTGTGGQ